MKKPKTAPWRGFIVMTLLVALCMPAIASEIQMISKSQLNQLLGNPNVMVVDVRSAKDWQSSNVKIKGAVRKAPQNY
jgi:hypothetical protein